MLHRFPTVRFICTGMPNLRPLFHQKNNKFTANICSFIAFKLQVNIFTWTFSFSGIRASNSECKSICSHIHIISIFPSISSFKFFALNFNDNNKRGMLAIAFLYRNKVSGAKKDRIHCDERISMKSSYYCLKIAQHVWEKLPKDQYQFTNNKLKWQKTVH